MTSPACAITETPPILYAVCTGLARAISTPLKTLVKSRSKRLPLVHVVYCGGSALRNFAAFLTALHRTSPAGKCRTFPVRESGKMRPKNTPEKAEKKPFIIAFNPEPKEQFRKVWKGWQFKAPKRHYRLILTPVANHVSAAPRIVGDFTKLQSALDAAIQIESPQLYRLSIFNSRGLAVIRNAGRNPEKVERAPRQPKAEYDASKNMHRPITIEKLIGLNERITRKGEYRSR
ncbi:hypothetical protein ELZ18_16010 [Brucella abortus]|nr:hypothetical protein [Brucella abortus]RUQ67059.1 hypothetical protein ELZ23_15935 [Brucella abortus]RUQ77938.1 hypothetical protein ELZ22_17605 [Brucella abortus]RUQ88162.1 hypothetical protein ELZ18_16010 [Brucella abortus]